MTRMYARFTPTFLYCDLCDVNEKAQKANNYTHNTKIPMSN